MRKRKSVKHFHGPGHLHELTFTCNAGQPLLSIEGAYAKLAESVQKADDTLRFDLIAFVFMTNHVHLLVRPPDDNPVIGLYLAMIKRTVSGQMREAMARSAPSLIERLLVQERPGKRCFRFLQEGGGYDRNLWTRESVLASMDYIHANPVRRGHVVHAVDWPWSSARYYLGDPRHHQHPGLPLISSLGYS